MLLEVPFLDFLPAGHNSRLTLDLDSLPQSIEILVIDGADVLGVAGESYKIVARGLVIVVGHRICKSSDDCFRDVCPNISK